MIIKPKRALFFVVLMVTLLNPHLSFSESLDSVEMDSLGEELTLFEDIPSVFGASKYEQKVTEAPSSVTIITADEIKKYGYKNLGDILQSVRSFYISNDRNYQYIGVRGFSIPGDYNARILQLVDGHKINDNVYDGASSDNVFPVDIDLIDRIEVIRGPSSSIYGTSAFFGVLNIITKRGRDYQGVEVSGEAASHDTYDGRLTYGQRYTNGLEVLVSGTASDSDGDDWYYKEYDDPDTNNGIAEDLDGENFYSLFLKATLGDFTLVSAWVDRDKDVPTASYETFFNDPNYTTTDKRFYLNLKYDHLYENDVAVQARVFYDYYKYEGDYPYDWNEDPSDPDVYVGFDEARGTSWGTEIQFSKRLLDKHMVVLGGEFRDNLDQDQAYYDIKNVHASQTFSSDEDSTSWAVFIQDDFKLLDNLVISAGLRYDDYSTFGGSTNPRVAVIYNPLEKTTIKFLYGSAFRAPNAYELYYDDGLYQKGNSDLDPEEIETYEVVLEQYIGDHFRTVLSGYYYELEDLIQQKIDPADDLAYFDNIGKVDAWGIEFEMEGKFHYGIASRISYTYQETENQETDDELANSPKHLAKLNITVPVWREKVFLGIEQQYTSSRKSYYGDEELGGFAVTNLTLFAQQLYQGLEVSASVYNLFDKKYDSVGGAEHLMTGIEQDDRNYRLKISYLF
jgi:iron complex outermembrane receptor protein